eukprot:TRINITY_DN12403_c0_g1_i1.p4 TRINITY_DN12403_c0_g1~~TRINITY_DN12403_c0_g1_i1.p4  ORF type:complete len:175 (+),score=22.30 TRINITY_DN12403_c0_g1_i1:3527-4051(+)
MRRKLQGPVVSSAGTAQILRIFPRVDYITMIGICGGRRLGDVIIGKEAMDQAGGRLMLDEESSVSQPSFPHKHKVEELNVLLTQVRNFDPCDLGEPMSDLIEREKNLAATYCGLDPIKFESTINVGKFFSIPYVCDDFTLGNEWQSHQVERGHRDGSLWLIPHREPLQSLATRR